VESKETKQRFILVVKEEFALSIKAYVEGIQKSYSWWAFEGLSPMRNVQHHIDLLHGGEQIKYGSMVYVYGWMMEEHQPIDIDYQPIQDDNYIKDSVTQHYMEFDEDRQAN